MWPLSALHTQVLCPRQPGKMLGGRNEEDPHGSSCVALQRQRLHAVCVYRGGGASGAQDSHEGFVSALCVLPMSGPRRLLCAPPSLSYAAPPHLWGSPGHGSVHCGSVGRSQNSRKMYGGHLLRAKCTHPGHPPVHVLRA